MKRALLLTAATLAMTMAGFVEMAGAGERTLMGAIAHRRAQKTPWHGNYYESAWGMPVALVVPPTAAYQTKWGWGVGNTRSVPIYHQFERTPTGPGYYNRSQFLPTPAWPSDTDQFGVYYVRDPW